MKNRVIRMCVGSAIAMLVLGIAGGAAMAGYVDPDSTTWEHAYEADLTPADHGPPLEDNGNATITVVPDGGNNYINVLSGNDYYHGFRYLENPGTLDPQTNGGLAVEFRVRKDGSGQLYSRLWASSATASRNLSIYVSNTNITIKDNDTGVSGTGNTMGDNEWTTFRITCDDVNWTLTRMDDASQQAQIPVVYNGGPYGLFQWQMYEVYPNLAFDLDYMRMTDGVPEPATMGLLALGGLLGLRRKRR